MESLTEAEVDPEIPLERGEDSVSARMLGPDSPLAQVLGGYENRAGQIEMARQVEIALERSRHLFVEAGTGTGKTLAYLVPALLSGRKVVISTATKALEDQIFTKDVPLVRKLFEKDGLTFSVALMKGLPNYLCRRRLGEVLGSGRGVDGTLARIAEWAKETETGDRAELPFLPEDSDAWREVQSSTETRIGAGCKHFDECFVTQMRRDAAAADLVIVNHHLFFADLSLRQSGDFASAIPPYDAVIFDEAHQIEQVATDFFGVRVSSHRVETIVRDARRAFIAAELLDVLGKGDARNLLESAEQVSKDFFASISSMGDRTESGRRMVGERSWTADARAKLTRLTTTIEGLGAYAMAHDEKEQVALISRRFNDLYADLRMLAPSAPKSYEPDAEVEEPKADVAWIDVRERSVAIGASPVDIGDTLRNALFDRVSSVICTSATLATSSGGVQSFHFAKARLGAPADVAELVVDSPFDYASRALLYLPDDLPEPSSPEFDREAAERALELIKITDGGAFVLCTSVRSMRALHARLRERVPGPIFLQGEAPKHMLLSRFRSTRNGVLVATSSFWEGVDVPGHALRLVVLDKIPFAVPTDPVVAARSARIDREGGNSFSQYSVPSAAITLKQGFGRLIRTQTDYGIVALLDRRATKKGYGKPLLRSLPPAARVSTLEEVSRFYERVSNEPGGSIRPEMMPVSPSDDDAPRSW